MVSDTPGAGPVHVSLDGKWRLYYFPQGKYHITQPDQLQTPRLPSVEASVPGNVELDLSRQGQLPADLLYGDNILKLKPYELYEWWYQREFPTPEGIAGRRLELRFGGVDCLATYWLNGKKLGETANALVEQHFDVTGKLNSTGPNLLTIRLRSAHHRGGRQAVRSRLHHQCGAYQRGGHLDPEGSLTRSGGTSCRARFWAVCGVPWNSSSMFRTRSRTCISRPCPLLPARPRWRSLTNSPPTSRCFRNSGYESRAAAAIPPSPMSTKWSSRREGSHRGSEPKVVVAEGLRRSQPLPGDDPTPAGRQGAGVTPGQGGNPQAGIDPDGDDQHREARPVPFQSQRGSNSGQGLQLGAGGCVSQPRCGAV